MASAKVADWNFPHIKDAEPIGEDDRELVADVRAVLEKHGALSRFGLALLHQHFPVGTDEVLCEEVDTGKRILTSVVAKRSTSEQEPHTPTLWDLRANEPVVLCRCKDYGNGHSHWPS